ncbi:M23 family metallopeptidase [Rhodococcus aerolatus]
MATAAARLAELDASTDALGRAVEEAQTTLTTRRGELATARAAAGAAERAAGVEEMRAAVLRNQVDDLVAAALAGSRTSRLSAVLTARSPQELLDQMTVLDVLGRDSAARLAQSTAAQVAADRADASARAAADAAGAAEATALREQEGLVAQRRTLESQTAAAQALLTTLRSDPQPAPGIVAAVEASTRADVSRASRATAVRNALYAQPTTGQVTSSYGARGGGSHGGLDIANAIGTPVYSVADGVVIDAGPADGFGLWVRVRHDDGTITVYGHIDSYSVSVGQRVAAGEQIARMGNRGQSTGPHLHIEVLTPGGGKADPRSWLAERGISM